MKKYFKSNCGASFEDAIHYFLECSLYLNERRTLLSNCDDININIENIDMSRLFQSETVDGINELADVLDLDVIYNTVIFISKWEIWEIRNKVKYNQSQIGDQTIFNTWKNNFKKHSEH
jgi:hypothetical protein